MSLGQPNVSQLESRGPSVRPVCYICSMHHLKALPTESLCKIIEGSPETFSAVHTNRVTLALKDGNFLKTTL